MELIGCLETPLTYQSTLRKIPEERNLICTVAEAWNQAFIYIGLESSALFTNAKMCYVTKITWVYQRGMKYNGFLPSDNNLQSDKEKWSSALGCNE
jgi:hypothetical protein